MHPQINILIVNFHIIVYFCNLPQSLYFLSIFVHFIFDPILKHVSRLVVHLCYYHPGMKCDTEKKQVLADDYI